MRRAKTDRAPREHRLFGGRADCHAHTDAMRLRKRERPDVGTEVRHDVWLDRVAAGPPPPPRRGGGAPPRGRGRQLPRPAPPPPAPPPPRPGPHARPAADAKATHPPRAPPPPAHTPS